MHTIQLQIQDDIYHELNSKGIDINNKLQEFLHALVDDGYATISTDEAKQRVLDAVNRYENNTGMYLDSNNYVQRKSDMIDSIKSKYANN